MNEFKEKLAKKLEVLNKDVFKKKFKKVGFYTILGTVGIVTCGIGYKFGKKDAVKECGKDFERYIDEILLDHPELIQPFRKARMETTNRLSKGLR